MSVYAADPIFSGMAPPVDPFTKFIVLKSSIGNVRDSAGYGFDYNDIIAIATAINASRKPGAREYDVWFDVVRRAKRSRKRTVEPC